MDLKERILDLLEKRNLTIKQLAEKIGMSETGFHSTLKNNTFKFETIVKICQILGVNVSYFTDKFAGEPINFNNPFNEIKDQGIDFSKEPDQFRSYEVFTKMINISLDLNRKSKGMKFSNALSTIFDINEFLEEYYKKHYFEYMRIMNGYIEKSLIDKKSKSAIFKELLPHLVKKLNEPKLNPKPIFKLEKLMINTFNEIKQHVTEEDEDLFEMIGGIEVDIEHVR